MGRKRDLLSIIEAAYEIDGTDAEWCSRLAESVRANIPFRALGVVVNPYDISDRAHPKLAPQGVYVASDDVDRLRYRWRELQAFFERDVQRTGAGYGGLDEGLGLEIPADGREPLAALLGRLNMGDVYGVNGRNPSGRGCLVGVYLPRDFDPISPSTRRLFARIGRHVAAAYRLRQRLAGAVGTERKLDEADAVIRADGKVEHAAGAARPLEAREELRRAAAALAAARGGIRRTDPDQAIATWRALVDARWSLIDHFERGGTHYLVAHRNDCQPAPIALLTQRERQVVALAAMGYSNKAIAYDLGIATSTVGVLVSRALARLGLRSRRELRRLFGAAS